MKQDSRGILFDAQNWKPPITTGAGSIDLFSLPSYVVDISEIEYKNIHVFFLKNGCQATWWLFNHKDHTNVSPV